MLITSTSSAGRMPVLSTATALRLSDTRQGEPSSSVGTNFGFSHSHRMVLEGELYSAASAEFRHEPAHGAAHLKRAWSDVEHSHLALSPTDHANIASAT